jgi:hypothetical protein
MYRADSGDERNLLFGLQEAVIASVGMEPAGKRRLVPEICYKSRQMET